ncbi:MULTISPECIES: aminoacyl-tRNA hydrolase [unclassified Actinomyces]|uniref:aminoacyl-tRNA hydrolase n=1 Tax=unclassified Actinomyces TaxID=2609248 RepID=UPI0020178520|nr:MULTISPECIES: aminoacyl-tRNA hydrolase [unclassified Actinomyces]MCL3776834.1 aminoacyl-tRNA hydrolase [Actinomyces sp. AC-20-1]MCL3790685.1 aminoacyl-tRNA hydrolase [Actinomyces sp. 187325]MCL3792791.1 aminoacyl-tRNA hydrolase [Actinomyces sp. 186855]MCL3795460.1 aminoacyl-tRNA hydrolase [Actinomyces sp. 217892]
MSDPWLIVGLGNPETRYARNRHNVGHMVIDVLAGRTGSRLSRHKTRAQVAEARLGTMPGGAPGPRVILATPATYMNTSGGPVKALAQFYGVEPTARLLVIHDELDIPAHELRLKRGGGEGGHNGLRSISQALGTRGYARLRVGVGRPPGRQDPADYVLSDFPARERDALAVTLEQAADAVEEVVALGLEAAQGRLHRPTS